MNPKTLLIDLDGTLVRSTGFRLQASFIYWILKEFRKTRDFKSALKGIASINQASKSEHGNHTNAERTGMALGKAWKMETQAAFDILESSVRAVFQKIQHFFIPIHGAVPFLDWAKTKYPLILATNPVWTQEIIEVRVRRAGIDPAIFKSITHAHRMHSTKPSLNYYRELLDQEGLKAEECLLIGNEMENDWPAVKVGIPVFIVTKNSRFIRLKRQEGQAPSWSGSFSDLQKLLEEGEASCFAP